MEQKQRFFFSPKGTKRSESPFSFLKNFRLKIYLYKYFNPVVLKLFDLGDPSERGALTQILGFMCFLTIGGGGKS